MEWLKDLSDTFLIWLLKRTSRFGQELTRDGRNDQALWREQRQRNLRGLALRSQERLRNQAKSSQP